MTLFDVLSVMNPDAIVTVADYISGKIYVLTDTADRILAFFDVDKDLHSLKSRRVCSISVGDCGELIVLISE